MASKEHRLSPRGFAIHGLAHFWIMQLLGHPPGNAPTPRPNRFFLFEPWSFTTQAPSQNDCFVGVWSSAPRAFYRMLSSSGHWEIHYLQCSQPRNVKSHRIISERCQIHSKQQCHKTREVQRLQTTSKI